MKNLGSALIQTIDKPNFPQIVGADLVSARVINSIILLSSGGHEVLPYIFETNLSATYPIVTRGSPVLTVVDLDVWILFITPSFGDTISFSIFIASSINTMSPAFTV